MGKVTILVWHGLALFGLFVVAVSLTTWRGSLWPLDLRFSALITAGGIAILILGWGPVWLAPLLAAAIFNRPWQLLVIWLLAIIGFTALHQSFGPSRGFMPIEQLTLAGAFYLYAIPAALAALIGSALRESFRRGAIKRATKPDCPGQPTAR